MNHQPQWMQPTRAICMAAALLLAVSWSTASTPAPQAMQHLLPQAEAVLIVPSLAGLSESVAAMRQSLDLDLPEMDDALGIFKRQSGMVQGVNDEGAMLVVVLNLSEVIAQDAEPATVMLMPVLDYAAFVGNFAGQADQPVTELVLPGGQTGYAKQLDGHAVMGKDRTVVEAYVGSADPAQLTALMGAAGGRYLTESDAAVFVNLEAIAPALLAALDEGFATAQAAIKADDMMMAEREAMVQPMLDLYAQAARTVVQSSRSLVMTVELAGEGIAITQALHYKADSPLASLFPGEPGVAGEAGQAGAMLARLPDQPFLLAAAFDARGLALAKLLEPMVAIVKQMRPVLAEQSPEDAALLADMDMEQSLALFEQVQGSASAMYVPAANAAMTGSFVRVASATQVEDPVAWLNFQRDYVRTINEAAQRESATISATYLENVLQIDGQAVDQMQVNLPPQMQAELGFMRNMMGGYLTVVNDSVLQISLGDQQLLRATIQSAREGAGLGAAGGVQQVREQALRGGNLLEMYLSVSGIMQTLNMVMPMMGGEAMQAPADLLPLAFGLRIEEHTLVGRTYLPHETTRFVSDAVKPWLGMLTDSAFDEMRGDEPGGPPRPPF